VPTGAPNARAANINMPTRAMTRPAHVFLHLTQGPRFDFFDEEEGDKTDRIEQESEQPHAGLVRA